MILFTFAMCYSAIGQKSSWYIGGQVGFNSTKVKDSDMKSSSWSFSPEVGTFLTDNVQLGLALNLTGSTDNGSIGGIATEEKLTGVGGTLYSRYFFKPGMPFRPFVGLNIGYSTAKLTNKGIGSNLEVKMNTFGANLNAGFGYAIAPKWTVVGSLGVLGFSSSKEGDNYTETNFGLDINTLGNRFTIGFYYTL